MHEMVETALDIGGVENARNVQRLVDDSMTLARMLSRYIAACADSTPPPWQAEAQKAIAGHDQLFAARAR